MANDSIEQPNSLQQFKMDTKKSLVEYDNSSDVPPISPPYLLYQKRYVILFLFTMAEFCNTVVYATCNPIANELGIIYKKTADEVTLSATLYLFMHPIFTFPASYLIMYKGNAYSVKLGALLTLLGVTSRCFVRNSFYWVLLGQTLSGIGRPFVVNSQASVTVEWFPARDRTKLITFLNFIVTFSGILGYIIPPIFFAGYTIDKNDAANVATGDDKFLLLVVSQALFCAVFMIPLLIIFQSKPETPPGPLPSASKDISFTQSICQMFKDLKFLLIFASFTLYYGSYKGYGVALVYILKPYGYGKSEIAYLSAMPVIGGFVSSLMIPSIYKKWKRYKPLVIFLEFMTILAFFAFIYACYLQSLALMLVLAVVQGFMLLPAIPLLLEWGCEQIYPLNDSFCIGLMYSGATMGSSFIAQILVIAIHGDKASKLDAFNGISIVCGLYFAAIMCIFFLKEVKHKLALKKSFLSQVEKIEADFPHAVPEGEPDQFGMNDLDSDETQQKKAAQDDVD